MSMNVKYLVVQQYADSHEHTDENYSQIYESLA